MPPQPWKVVSSKWDNSYSIFSVRTDRARSPRTGEEYDFYTMESLPWVNVIPITLQEEVVLIRQYRHGIREVALEIPGGVVESDETPEEAAIRELYEETGHKASKMISLGSVHPNPAIQNNLCYTYIAKDVIEVGEQQQDEKEDIEVLFRRLAEIPALIRKGEISHSLVLVAFYRFYMEYQDGYLTQKEE